MWKIYLVFCTAFNAKNLQVSGSCSSEVPISLQCTHLNVAATSSGASCTGLDCLKAIDGIVGTGSSIVDYEVAVPTLPDTHSVRITFVNEFLINKLKVMQLGSSSTQITQLRLHFSDSSSVTEALTPNTASYLIWEEFTFSARRVSWVELEAFQFDGSSGNFGYKEIEVYYDVCMKDRLCDRISLTPSNDSGPIPLVAETVMFSALMSNSFEFRLTTSSTSDDGYFVQIGSTAGEEMNLFRVQGSNTLLKTKMIPNIIDNVWRTFWVDYRCTHVSIGSGSTILLQYNDTTNHQRIHYITFENPVINATILLCNKEDMCYKDASFFWPLDKAIGGDVLDIDNNNRGRGSHLSMIEGRWVSGPSWNNVRSSAISIGNAGPIELGNLSAVCVGNPVFCARGITLAFWLKLIDDVATSQMILLSNQGAVGIGITAESNQLTAKVATNTDSWSVQFNISFDTWHHVAITWSDSEGLLALVNLVRTVKEGTGVISGSQPFSGSQTLRIGKGTVNFFMSNLVVYERLFSVSEIQKTTLCTGLFPDTTPESFSASYGLLPDDSFQATSSWDENSGPSRGRALVAAEGPLLGGWRAKEQSTPQYLQIDLLQVRNISALITQGMDPLGCGCDQWVTNYTLSHSLSGAFWSYYAEGGVIKHFLGNSDNGTLVSHSLCPPLTARILRFHPTEWFNEIAMRIDVVANKKAVNYLGCFASPSGMTLSSHFIAVDLTPETCVTRCGKNVKGYAGLWNGSECYCSDTPPDPAANVGDALCYFPCLGNKALKCGSDLYFSVYEAPGQFIFPFSVSVPAISETLVKVSINLTRYEDADVTLIIGDGPVIKTLNSTYDFFSSYIGLVQVYAETVVGYYGEAQTVSDLKKIQFAYVIKGVSIHCPRVVEALIDFTCLLTVMQGSELNFNVTTPSGKNINGTIEDTRGEIAGLSTSLPSSVDQMSAIVADTTVFLPNYYFEKTGILTALRINLASAGKVNVQILRPLCILLPATNYCYADGSCTYNLAICSLYYLNYSCPSAYMSCGDNLDCLSSLPVCSYGGTTNVTLHPQYEVVYSTTLNLPKGESFVPANNSKQPWSGSLNVRRGDILAVGLVNIGGARLVSENSGAKAFLLSDVNLQVGDTIETEGNSAIVKIQHRFDLAAFHLAISERAVTLNYPIGPWSQRATVVMKEMEFTVVASVSIQNISWVIPEYAATNKTFYVDVRADAGHNVTYRIRINQGSDYIKYNESRFSFFFTSAQDTNVVPFFFGERGKKTLMLTASNPLSSSLRECHVTVMDPIEDLYLFNITPTALGNNTEISWSITKGENVTYVITFGDGNSVSGILPYLGVFVASNTHLYSTEGSFNVTIFAYNIVSNKSVSGIADVVTPIENLSCSVIHAARDIEVNETIQLSTNYSKGAGAEVIVHFGDGSSTRNPTWSEVCQPDCDFTYYHRIAHSYSKWGNFSTNVTFSNLVSTKSCFINVFVHKPVYKLLGFNVTCPPANLSTATVCMLNITEGNDFWCDWQFGGLANQIGSSHFWSLSLPVENTYPTVGEFLVSLSCRNRLYETTATGLAVVQDPITDLEVNGPSAQSVDANFDLDVVVTSGTSMDFQITMTNIFTNDLTYARSFQTAQNSLTIPVTNASFSVVGVYRLMVKVENLVTPQQTRVLYINVDKPISNLRLQNDLFIPVNATISVNASIDTGTNVTVDWDFNDGVRWSLMFPGDSMRYSSDFQQHSYSDHGSFLLNTTASNPVSSMTVLKYIYVQYLVKNIILASDTPQEYPPGNVTFIVFVQPGTHPPTNATIDMDFGEGQNVRDVPLEGQRSINISNIYSTTGERRANMTIRNEISAVQLEVWVDVQRRVKGLLISAYHTGGEAGYGAPGQGPQNSSFPIEYAVLFFANITDGTVVTYTWDFGDGTPTVETNSTSVLHSFPIPRYYTIILNAKNSINGMTVNQTVRIMKSTVNVTFENDSPTVHNHDTTFAVMIGQLGTDACFLVDLGNETKVLYMGLSNATCNSEVTMTLDIRVLPSLNFTFTFNYWQTAYYRVRLLALNDVSRITIEGWAIILTLPCDFPIVHIPDAGRTYHIRTKYFRAEYTTIKSRCVINCMASRDTQFIWDLKNATGHSFNDLENSLPVLIIKERTIPYGVYELHLNVSMVGLPLVSSVGVAYIEFLPSPLVAEIIGGNSLVRSVSETIIFDASPSHDPDFGLGDKEGLEYFWYCKTADENYEFPNAPNEDFSNQTGGCLRNGTRRLQVYTEILTIKPGILWVNETYIIKFFIAKGTRTASFVVRLYLTEENPLSMFISNIHGVNLERVNPSNKFSIQAECLGCSVEQLNTVTLSWSLRVIETSMNITTSVARVVEQKAYNINDWPLVPDLSSMTRSGVDNEYLIMRAKSLKPSTGYVARVEGYVGDRAIGHAELIIQTGTPPSGGRCYVILSEGSFLDPRNTLVCEGWTSSTGSTDLMFVYFFKFSPYGAEYMVQYTHEPVIHGVRLPIGDKEHDYKLYMKAVISDSYGGRIEVTFDYESPPNDLDDADLLNMLLEEISIYGTLSTLEMEGYSQFTNQYVFSVSWLLNSMSERRASNITRFNEISSKIRERMSETLSHIQMDEIKTVRETAHALAAVAAVPDQCSRKTQSLINTTLHKMVDLVTKQSPISDATELWDTINNVSEAVGNALGAVSYDLKTIHVDHVTHDVTNNNYKETGKQLIQQFLEYVNILKDSYLSHVLPKEEASQFRSPSLSFTLIRDYPGGLSLRDLHCGLGKAILPDEFGAMFLEENRTAYFVIDALVITSPYLPFIWTITAKKVNSHVLIVEIRDEIREVELEVANLSKPIDMRIQKNEEHMQASKGEVEYTKTLQHRFEVADNRSAINIDIRVLGEYKDQPMLVVYLRKGEPPSMDGSELDTVRVIPQLDSEQESNTTRVEQDSRDPNLLFYSNKQLNQLAAGKYYVIVEFKGSLSGAKVPNENRTIKYLFSAYASDCLYWEEELEIWIETGCEVGPLSNSTHTQCLCNHLSSFASGFFVPPNKIDWSKITFSELFKNPTVTIIVCCTILLYFLVLIWARRKDKQDLELMGVTPLPSNDPRDLFGYEIVVFTGFDRGAGTTAAVSLVMTGSLEQTQPRVLRDPHPVRKKFQSGNVDHFLLTVPRSLGKIMRIRIWHNNAGVDPSWFLLRVLIRDLQTDKTTWFVFDSWLAVEEGDGMIDRTLHPATKQDLVKFNFLFCTEVRKNLGDGHLWYSVLHRPLRSTFTRVQRLSCCLSILLCSMVANAMFYQEGEADGEADPESKVEVQIGPIRLSARQIGIGVMSSLVVLPVNVVIVNIFRKARPKHDPNARKMPDNPNRIGFKFNDKDTVADTEEEESTNDEKEDVKSKAKKKKKKKEKKKEKDKKEFTLPHFTIYIAYVLIFLATTASATFTIFYSLTYGKEKSERWVSSMMISFWQDVLISQPIKVVIMAVLFALIIKDPEKATEDDGKQAPELGRDEEWIHYSYADQFNFRKVCEVRRPPGEDQLYQARQLRAKQKQMRAILREILLHSIFFIVLLIVVYGSRDQQAFDVKNTVEEIFSNGKYTMLQPFYSIGSAEQYWTWVEETLVPSLQPQYWYGPYIDPNEESMWLEENVIRSGREESKQIVKTKGGGSYVHHYLEDFSGLKPFPQRFTADRGLYYTVGNARLRQLRVTRGGCVVEKFLTSVIPDCSVLYSWEDEEEGAFLPGWEGMNETGVQQLPDEHQSPWIWQSAMELKGTPFWGIFASYWGGGFVFNFDTTRMATLEKTQDLQLDSWIDRYTRAVFAEFTVYNAHTNFFCAVTLLTEILPTGGFNHFAKISSLRLYRYTGPEQMVIMAFEFLLFFCLCIFVYSELKQIFIFGKKYFKDPWNYIESVVILLCFSAILVYLVGLGLTKQATYRMRRAPEAFISFDYIVLLDETYTATLGFAVGIAFLKFLKILRFNRRMSLLVQTVKVSAKPLVSFFFMFFVFFLAYAQAAFLIFGPANADYGTFVSTMQTLLTMTLGGFDFLGLQDANRVLGPIFFFSYMVFVFLILVNVFVSIVNDSFAEVRSDAEKQTNEHELLDYVMHLLKEQIGKQLGPPFKPLYKPALTDFEKALEDIENRSENIQYVLENVYLEEQRQTNWLKVEKSTAKKISFIRFLLHLDKDFDEDDFSSSISLMGEFLKKHNSQELELLFKKYQEQDFIGRFRGGSFDSPESFDEECYDQIDLDGSRSIELQNPLSHGDDGGEVPKCYSLDYILEEGRISAINRYLYPSEPCLGTNDDECDVDTDSPWYDNTTVSPENTYVEITDTSRSAPYHSEQESTNSEFCTKSE